MIKSKDYSGQNNKESIREKMDKSVLGCAFALKVGFRSHLLCVSLAAKESISDVPFPVGDT